MPSSPQGRLRHEDAEMFRRLGVVAGGEHNNKYKCRARRAERSERFHGPRSVNDEIG